MEYAGFWRRFGAMIIDGLIIGCLGLVLGIVSFNHYSVAFVVSLLYEPIFDSSFLQASPGKALLGMRVTDLQGQRIIFKKSFVRYVMKIISGGLFMIGYFIQLFTEKRQTLHDFVAETLVVRGEVKNVNFFRAWYEQVQDILGMVEKVPKSQSPSNAPIETAATPADLAALYELYQKGIFTESEYVEKREQLLKKLQL
ncbi:MAG: RDD family protein [Bdellovibrionaceae bacterium]|nr:RDD family protein [Pseudobdellovibrionaceae bacterium]